MVFLRLLLIAIDSVFYNLIDNAYNLIISISSATLNNDVVEKIIRNLYIVVGIFAFFRIALLLINSIIDPEKLNEKGKGLSNIFVRTVLMLVLLLLTPQLFSLAFELQSDITGYELKENETTHEVEVVLNSNGNIIEKLLLGGSVPEIDSSDNNTMTPGDI